jgi:hypothetical protein
LSRILESVGGTLVALSIVDLLDGTSDRWRTVGLCDSLVETVLLLAELQAHCPRVD